jgi:hypothetical protein
MWEVGGGTNDANSSALLSHERELTTWVANMGLRDPLGAGRKSILKNLLITTLAAFQFDLSYLVDVSARWTPHHLRDGRSRREAH